MKVAIFETGITDEQWIVLEPCLPAANRGGRPRTPLRPIINALLYVSGVAGNCSISAILRH